MISFVILGSALSVLVTGYETYSRSRDASIVSLDRKLDADLKFMRKQRNFWVSLLLLVLWMYASCLSVPFRFPFSPLAVRIHVSLYFKTMLPHHHSLVYFMLKLSQSMAAAEQQLEQLKLEKRLLEEERDRASDLVRIQSARAAASANERS